MYRKILLMVWAQLTAAIVVNCAPFPDTRIPAFPGAEGYGMFTTGGRGGEVYEVTSLEDSGPGSLRDGISKPNRIIIFNISGNIELRSNLTLSASNITIAGQSAPGDGICIKNYALRINADNIIIRYIRIRPGADGSDDQVDGISMGPKGGRYLIFDHCSVSWAIDENFSIYGLPNVTVQWCIISEALQKSKHPKGAHGMGGIMNGYDMTIHHNLFASNNDRNPKIDVGDWWPGKNTDFRNNVVYNWGARSTWGGNGGMTVTNIINNYYKSGPSSRHPRVFLTLAGGTAGQWHVSGNSIEDAPEVESNNSLGVTNTGAKLPLNAIWLANPFPSPPVRTQSATEAYKTVLSKAGATHPIRDKVDARIVESVLLNTGNLINSPSDVGGWPVLASSAPPLDSDHDGMPDIWEKARGLDPYDASDRNILDQYGYTQIEAYLNSLVDSVDYGYSRIPPTAGFFPDPSDSAGSVDNAPELRWIAGFSTEKERIYFGESFDLTEQDFKAEIDQFREFKNKQEVSSSRFTPGVLDSNRTYYWRADQINSTGVTPGPVWSFTTAPPVSGPTGDRMEAENMTLNNCSPERSDHASEKYFVSVASGSGTLRFKFSRASGIYNISLFYWDESDGEGSMELSVNGIVLDNWRSDVNCNSLVARKRSNVQLNDGDIIKISIERHGDELGRVDFVDFQLID